VFGVLSNQKKKKNGHQRIKVLVVKHLIEREGKDLEREINIEIKDPNLLGTPDIHINEEAFEIETFYGRGILEELIQVNKNISTIKDIQSKMQKCKLCGRNASVLRAFYYNAFVCEECYEILDKPIPDHPQRLELRKKLYQNALKI